MMDRPILVLARLPRGHIAQASPRQLRDFAYGPNEDTFGPVAECHPGANLCLPGGAVVRSTGPGYPTSRAEMTGYASLYR